MATRPPARTAQAARPSVRPAARARRAAPLRPAVPAPPVWALVRGPAVLTLAVTLLRLLGERRGWSPSLFSTLPGGGLALVGITWLVLPVGLYLGWRLARLGFADGSQRRALFWPAVALAIAPLCAWLLDRLLAPGWAGAALLWGTASLAAAVVAFASWPALGRVLVAYALLARVPVMIVMGLAISAGWGTHYDAAPPGLPWMPPLQRWVWTGLVPQCTIWIGFTVATGALFGGLGRWLAGSRRSG